MKKILLFLSALLLAGCAHQQLNSAQSQFYRASDGETITFDGSLFTKLEDNVVQRTITRILTIKANGEEVINSGVHPLTLSGEFTGKYHGKTITAICSKGQAAMNCLILVNNERAVTLSIF